MTEESSQDGFSAAGHSYNNVILYPGGPVRIFSVCCWRQVRAVVSTVTANVALHGWGCVLPLVLASIKDQNDIGGKEDQVYKAVQNIGALAVEVNDGYQ